MTDRDINNSIQLLIEWVEKKGYDVIFERNGDNSIDKESKLIEINSSEKKIIQLITLLHECGHLLIYNHDTVNYFKKTSELSEDSIKYKTYTLIEEVEAWQRAEKFKKRLNININDSLWEEQKLLSIESYIKWAVKEK